MCRNLLDLVGIVAFYLIFSGNSKDGRSSFMASIHFLSATYGTLGPSGLLRSGLTGPQLLFQLFRIQFMTPVMWGENIVRTGTMKPLRRPRSVYHKDSCNTGTLAPTYPIFPLLKTYLYKTVYLFFIFEGQEFGYMLEYVFITIQTEFSHKLFYIIKSIGN